LQLAETARKRGRPKGALTIPHQDRARIVQDALNRLDLGETTDNIAKSHKVEPRTLRAWLLVDCPAEADHQRARYIASQLQNEIENIASAKEQIPLARARDSFKAWSWIAERRLPHLFAPKQDVTVNIVTDLANRLHHARERLVGSGVSELSQSQRKSLIDKKYQESER